MNIRLAVRPLATVGGLVLACSLFAAESAPVDAPGTESSPVTMLGEKAGQERADNGLAMQFVWCPPGMFTMGSPKGEKDRDSNEDPVPVTLSRGFWLGKYEVTRAQWNLVMDNEPWTGWIRTKMGDDVPATFVGWKSALEFGRKLTEQERTSGRLADGWEYTLPTEAQWEYACRAGSRGMPSMNP